MIVVKEAEAASVVCASLEDLLVFSCVTLAPLELLCGLLNMPVPCTYRLPELGYFLLYSLTEESPAVLSRVTHVCEG